LPFGLILVLRDDFLKLFNFSSVSLDIVFNVVVLVQDDVTFREGNFVELDGRSSLG